MTRSRVQRTLPRWIGGAVVIIGLGVGLSACSSDGVSLARQACAHVDRSLALYRQSQAVLQSDPARSATLGQQADTQLRDALPIAAQAAYQNGQWQALMTTVSESNRVPESHLVHALQDQCATANSLHPGEPGAPTTIPPPATVPPAT